MKIHSPEFERSLKREIKATVRREPALRKEARRTHRRGRRLWLAALYRLCLSFVLADFTWNTFQGSQQVDTALMVINLWLLTSFLYHTSRLLQLPVTSTDLAALRLLPADDATIFQWERDKFVITSLFCLADLLAGFGGLACILHFSLLQWALLLPFILLAGAFLPALVALAAARFPWVPYGLVYGVSYLLWIIGFLSIKHLTPSALIWIDQTAPGLNLLLPTGWPISLFHLLLPGHGWLAAVLLLPIAFIFCTVPSSLRLLRERFAYEEPLAAEAVDIVPAHLRAQSETSVMGQTAIEEGILSGAFLARQPWANGWMEKTLWRWLTPREKALAEFVFPSGLSLTRPWKKIVRNFAVVACAGLLTGLASSVGAFWIFSIGLFVIALQAIVPILNTGALFAGIPNSGVVIPVYAAYPMTFRELSRLLLKCSAIQMPFFSLLLLACLFLVAHLTGLGVGLNLLVAFNASLVFWGARFFILVFAFSSGTNDSSSFRLRTAILLVVCSFFCITFLVCAVTTGVFLLASIDSGTLSTLHPLFSIGSLFALLDGYLFFRLYGWFYHTIRFDLMRLPR